MSASRTLPKKHNPLVIPDASPDYEELLSRRRLGKTHLSVKPGQIGTSNATKPENLGVFEYAHLRAPIPKDLRGSEIFSANAAQQSQNTYFLMRRSRDGYISATGMFKIAFPWAKQTEEKREREYLKSRSETSEDEVAGNVWISPELALELAKEYKMLDWVRALLDPTDIVQKPSTPEKTISPPPTFRAGAVRANEQETPSSSARGRTRRSASPSKSAVPGRKIAQPRKSKQPRTQKESSAGTSVAANESLQTTLDAAASTAGSSIDEQETAQVDGEHGTKQSEDAEEQVVPVKKASVKVSAESTIDDRDGAETSGAKFSVDIPAGAPVVQGDTEEMISKAKEMVEETAKMEEKTSAKRSLSSRQANKRKAEDEDTDNADAESDSRGQPAKRAKVLENTLRRERVRNRALVGVTASLALAATIPYFF